MPTVRFGSAVTRDLEAPAPITISNKIILRLLRGPALSSDFGLAGYVPDYIGACNVLLRASGRHITGQPVRMLSPHGLMMKVRRYTMLRADGSSI